MEDKKLYIELVTPEKKIFSGYVLSVWFPGSQAPFQVLPNHAPIVSSLDPGILKYLDENNNLHKLAISGGFVDLQNNKISVLIEKAISKNDINHDKVSSLLNNAKENLRIAKSPDEKAKAQMEFAFAKACAEVLSTEN